MAFVADHPFLIAALAAVVVVFLGWRAFRAAIRAMRVYVRSLWPH